MRLWHIDLIRFLPKSQLLAQWRELNSIYQKEDRHILINYIYNYDKKYLKYFSDAVISAMQERKYKVNLEKYNKYFKDVELDEKAYIYPEHNFKYLNWCFNNLEEKYYRGQKDFDEDTYLILFCLYSAAIQNELQKFKK